MDRALRTELRTAHKARMITDPAYAANQRKVAADNKAFRKAAVAQMERAIAADRAAALAIIERDRPQGEMMLDFLYTVYGDDFNLGYEVYR